MSTATNTPASAGDDDIHRSDVDRSDIDGTALDPAAHAFLDSLPSRLRVVRARAARTREDLPARSGCEEDTVLGEAAQRVWDAETASARALAARLRALAALIESEGGDCADDVDTLRAAMALRVTHGVAHRELLAAHRAVDQLPRTLARLEAGALPSWWFQKVLRESEDLGDESRRLLDAALTAWPADIPVERFLTLLRALVRLLAEREKKEPSAPEEALPREVELTPDGRAGTGAASLRGPIPEVLAFWKRLDETAHAIQAAQRSALREGTEIPYDLDGIASATQRPVPLDRLRYDLMLNAEFDTDGVRVPAPRFRLNVTVPVFTLLGLSDAPGMLEGTIPLPPAVAREIAGGESVWYRILTDACTGAFLPLPPDRYPPTQAMLEHLRLRSSTCAVPGCTRPVSWASEADHIEEFVHADPARGGRTELENLHLLCWQHHQAKTAGDLDPTRLPVPASGPEPGAGRGPGRTRWRIGTRGEQVIAADDIDLGTRLAVEDLDRAWRAFVDSRTAPSPPPPPTPPPPSPPRSPIPKGPPAPSEPAARGEEPGSSPYEDPPPF